jgi:hypothetical protein
VVTDKRIRRRQDAGDRTQETGDWQETGDRRQETDKRIRRRQDAGDKTPETGRRRQETGCRIVGDRRLYETGRKRQRR